MTATEILSAYDDSDFSHCWAVRPNFDGGWKQMNNAMASIRANDRGFSHLDHFCEAILSESPQQTVCSNSGWGAVLSAHLPMAHVIASAVFCLLLFGFSLPAMAQLDQGTITGTVQDSTGDVPNAEVTLTSADTAIIFNTRTDGSGVYVFSPIKIGNYRISASAPSFRTTMRRICT